MKITTMPQIEKGIPIPPKARRASKWAELLNSMAVGDSFFLDRPIGGVLKPYINRGLVQGKFAVRSVDGGYRCWRVE